MNYERAELLDRLASEYVLGTLRGGALRRFERIRRTLPAAQAAVAAWEARLGRLAQAVPEVQPRQRVWSGIESRIGAPEQPTERVGWWQSIWKPALGFAFGAALTVGLVQTHPGVFMSVDQLAQRQQALPHSYVGLLTDSDGTPTLLVSSTRHGTRVSVKFLRPVAVPPGKVIQVWALPKEGAPFALGVAAPAAPPASTTFDLAAASEKLLADVPRLAVSFEDAPAAPGAAPSGFVLSGHCVKLW